MRLTPDRPSSAGAVRVTTLELFFDLVFVFTITQLTEVLTEHPTGAGVAQAALTLGVVFWMYGGYAWMTNAVPPTDPALRGLLLVGMAGFLVMALALPDAFGDDGIAFGVAYVVVTAVHTAMYTKAGGVEAWAILRLGRFNIAAALLVLTAGFVQGAADWWLWGAAVAVQVFGPFVSHTVGGFRIRPVHFVERHGLLLIIVLGESVVAVGIGAAGLPVDLALSTGAVLALALTVALWWAYFDHDDEAAEHALTALPEDQRSPAALRAFGYAFAALLAGIVTFAAGTKKSIGHIADPVGGAGAWYLGSGIALFLLGTVAFRLALSTGAVALRMLAAAAVLATVPLGIWVSAWSQLVALLVVMVVCLAAEHRRSHAET
ncbi:MAG: low temperature requirement protein A [Candidatus Nanopelagicales bacterium]